MAGLCATASLQTSAMNLSIQVGCTAVQLVHCLSTPLLRLCLMPCANLPSGGVCALQDIAHSSTGHEPCCAWAVAAWLQCCRGFKESLLLCNHAWLQPMQTWEPKPCTVCFCVRRGQLMKGHPVHTRALVQAYVAACMDPLQCAWHPDTTNNHTTCHACVCLCMVLQGSAGPSAAAQNFLVEAAKDPVGARWEGGGWREGGGGRGVDGGRWGRGGGEGEGRGEGGWMEAGGAAGALIGDPVGARWGGGGQVGFGGKGRGRVVGWEGQGRYVRRVRQVGEGMPNGDPVGARGGGRGGRKQGAWVEGGGGGRRGPEAAVKVVWGWGLNRGRWGDG